MQPFKNVSKIAMSAPYPSTKGRTIVAIIAVGPMIIFKNYDWRYKMLQGAMSSEAIVPHYSFKRIRDYDLQARMIDSRDAVIVRDIHDKKSSMDNETSLRDTSLNEEYILDRTDIKAIFITLYTIVFVSCFLGNSMVILVVTFSRRLRSITNFFLANLAVADFCVGIFCVYQTLTNYLMNSWPLGDVLCKVYMFVHALSYTASVLILMVVCIERYLAIVYPIKCRSVLTRSRLQLVIGIVWIVAAIYALPRFFYVETMENRLITGDVDVICIANIQKHNKTLLDAVNLVFLYLLPLLLMSCLYSRIAVGLRRSGTTLGGPGLATKSKNDSLHRVHDSSRNVLRARRGVIRMLIAVVMMFAVCNLPQQARIAWRHWSSNSRAHDFYITLPEEIASIRDHATRAWSLVTVRNPYICQQAVRIAKNTVTNNYALLAVIYAKV
ncbi:Neuropeptide FF receptor 1 [Melipona quadrifasciata]|uniref:Neuropeptide FF receptor 1 n=1 Tax=Melipona quadrifasciata TaxID=166423 RepID=A0A0M9A001_9HYME|nr:Neuropeptide FF receptor 1 [Melipona quadrifasciata]